MSGRWAAAHLLVLGAREQQDFALLDAAVELGHHVTYVAVEPSRHQPLDAAQRRSLARAARVLHVRPHSYAALKETVLDLHLERPFHGILPAGAPSLVDASRIAERLCLRFLNPQTARLLQDKPRLRAMFARAGLQHPAQVTCAGTEELCQAIDRILYPVLLGGSAPLPMLVQGPDQFAPVLQALQARQRAGEQETMELERIRVAQFVTGQVIGCDVFTADQQRVLLGLSEMHPFAPPALAARSRHFPAGQHDVAAIREFAFEALDAIGVDFGHCHLDMVISSGRPWLLDIEPRLGMAQTASPVAYAYDRSLDAALIELHVGRPLIGLRLNMPRQCCAIRWLAAPRPGRLYAIDLPQTSDSAIRQVVVQKTAGDVVRPPLRDQDRLGYVVATGESEAAALASAERYASQVVVRLH